LDDRQPASSPLFVALLLAPLLAALRALLLSLRRVRASLVAGVLRLGLVRVGHGHLLLLAVDALRDLATPVHVSRRDDLDAVQDEAGAARASETGRLTEVIPLTPAERAAVRGLR